MVRVVAFAASERSMVREAMSPVRDFQTGLILHYGYWFFF
jgi:hypothetical protein